MGVTLAPEGDASLGNGTAARDAGSSFGYRPALDGLRTVAVYLVMAYHAGTSRFAGGSMFVWDG